jgi:hypothetical protein
LFAASIKTGTGNGLSASDFTLSTQYGKLAAMPLDIQDGEHLVAELRRRLG